MKTKFFLTVLPVFLLYFLCGCYGDLLQLQEGMPSDLTVEQITERMARASDPNRIYANAKSYYMKQKLLSDNVNGSDECISEIFWRAPNYMKQVSYRNGEVINIIISGKGRFWYVNPRNKKSREITGKDAQLVKAYTDIANPGQNYQKSFHTVTVDRIMDEKKGRTVYRLICKVENPDIAPYVFYIDPKTWLTDRCETIIYGPDGSRGLYVADSEEYEIVDGIRMPKKTLVTVDGKTDTAETLVFTLNPEIPLSTFDLEKPWNH